jgi:hypothetical protein
MALVREQIDPTHTIGRTPLNEWSAGRRGRYLHNTQHSQQTDVHVPGGIRTRNPSNQAAANLRPRPQRSPGSADFKSIA